MTTKYHLKSREWCTENGYLTWVYVENKLDLSESAVQDLARKLQVRRPELFVPEAENKVLIDKMGDANIKSGRRPIAISPLLLVALMEQHAHSLALSHNHRSKALESINKKKPQKKRNTRRNTGYFDTMFTPEKHRPKYFLNTDRE